MSAPSQSINDCYMAIDACRSCGTGNLVDVLPLGTVPLADRFPSLDSDPEGEPNFPLTVTLCEACSLVQLRETVAPEVLFDSDYPYYSSFSSGWLDHCRKNALELIESEGLSSDSLVVELASNDGYLLKNFAERDIPVLGIDPAPGPAAEAQERGIPTLVEFFSRDLAETLVNDGRQADVILANNVLAHVADLNSFVEGIRVLLKPTGVAVIEMPYVRDLLDHCEFDTIYHEHLCYYSVTSLSRLFANHGMSLRDVRRLPTHGGSLRIYVTHGQNDSAEVNTMMDQELQHGLLSAEHWMQFSNRVQSVQDGLRNGLMEFKSQGHSIWGYGAAAKGTTLLNTSGIGLDLIDRIVDRNIHKHGLLMPGVHIPIGDPGELTEVQPDYLLLLAWNHRDEIMKQQERYRENGGRFLVPVPQFKTL